MKTNENATKNPKIGEIWGIFCAFRAQKLVKSQKDFAQLCGISDQTLSAALRNREGYLTDNLLSRVRETARQYGVDISGTLNAGGDVTIDNSQKILPADTDTAKWFALVGEKDKQIDRLLGIIENMQGK